MVCLLRCASLFPNVITIFLLSFYTFNTFFLSLLYIQNPARSESSEGTEQASENCDCSEVFTLFNNDPCASCTSSVKNCGNPSSIKKFIPILEDINHTSEMIKDGNSQIAIDNKEAMQYTDNDCDVDIGRLEGIKKSNLNTNSASMEKKAKHKKPDEATSNCLMQDTNERSKKQKCCVQSNSQISQSDIHVCHIPELINESMPAKPEHHTKSTTSFNQEHPSSPPFTFFHGNQDVYRSLINMSSSFSNCILFCLQQNPSAHVAANLAASVWHCLEGDGMNSTAKVVDGGNYPNNAYTAPNMVAIASATVAAATAWWATHGLHTFPHPHSTDLNFAGVAPIITNPVSEGREVRKDDSVQFQAQQDERILDSESPQTAVLQCSTSKSTSSSDCGESKRGDEVIGGNTTKSDRKVNCYSYGSSKLSSTEKYTNVLLKNTESQTLEQVMKSNKLENQTILSEANGQRIKGSMVVNDSWKEVSEEVVFDKIFVLFSIFFHCFLF